MINIDYASSCPKLLEETLDSGGHPLTTSPNALRDIVLPPSLISKLLSNLSTPGMCVLSSHHYIRCPVFQIIATHHLSEHAMLIRFTCLPCRCWKHWTYIRSGGIRLPHSVEEGGVEV
jgi:hypothetical protein